MKNRIKHAWKESPYFEKLRNIDRRLVEGRTNAYMEMTKGMQRRHISILTQLRTGHAPLNKFLHRIGKSDTEMCPYCNKAPETVKHFLIDCTEWGTLRIDLERIDSRKSKETRHLVGNEIFIKETLKFVDRTGRWRKSHGEEEKGGEETKDEENKD